MYSCKMVEAPGSFVTEVVTISDIFLVRSNSKNALYKVNRDESNVKKLHRPISAISTINSDSCNFMFYKNWGRRVIISLN
jgi:hypothetical protein